MSEYLVEILDLKNRVANLEQQLKVASLPAPKIGCDHLDAPYRRVLAERDEAINRATALAKQLEDANHTIGIYEATGPLVALRARADAAESRATRLIEVLRRFESHRQADDPHINCELCLDAQRELAGSPLKEGL